MTRRKGKRSRSDDRSRSREKRVRFEDEDLDVSPTHFDSTPIYLYNVQYHRERHYSSTGAPRETAWPLRLREDYYRPDYDAHRPHRENQYEDFNDFTRRVGQQPASEQDYDHAVHPRSRTVLNHGSDKPPPTDYSKSNARVDELSSVGALGADRSDYKAATSDATSGSAPLVANAAAETLVPTEACDHPYGTSATKSLVLVPHPSELDSTTASKLHSIRRSSCQGPAGTSLSATQIPEVFATTGSTDAAAEMSRSMIQGFPALIHACSEWFRAQSALTKSKHELKLATDNPFSDAAIVLEHKNVVEKQQAAVKAMADRVKRRMSELQDGFANVALGLSEMHTQSLMSRDHLLLLLTAGLGSAETRLQVAEAALRAQDEQQIEAAKAHVGLDPKVEDLESSNENLLSRLGSVETAITKLEAAQEVCVRDVLVLTQTAEDLRSNMTKTKDNLEARCGNLQEDLEKLTAQVDQSASASTIAGFEAQRKEDRKLLDDLQHAVKEIRMDISDGFEDENGAVHSSLISRIADVSAKVTDVKTRLVSLERKSKQHDREGQSIIAIGSALEARLDLLSRALTDQEQERSVARVHALDVARLDTRLQTLEDVDHQAHERSDRDALLDLDKRFSKMTTLEFALLLSEQLHPRLLSARDARIEKLETMIKACETELVAVKAQPTGLDETQVQALFDDVCSKMQSQQDESHERIEKLERKFSETIFVHPQIHDLSGRHSSSRRDHLKVEVYTTDQGST